MISSGCLHWVEFKPKKLKLGARICSRQGTVRRACVCVCVRFLESARECVMCVCAVCPWVYACVHACLRACVDACVCVYARVYTRARDVPRCVACPLREYVRECNTLYVTLAVFCVRVNVCRRAHVRTFVCMMPLNDAAQLTQPVELVIWRTRSNFLIVVTRKQSTWNFNKIPYVQYLV